MKNTAVGAITAITLLSLLFFWQHSKGKKAKPMLDGSASPTVERSGSGEQPIESPSRRPTSLSGLNEWRSPIDFWGIVVEPDGTPVADATVVFEWTDLSLDGSSREVLQSGTDGKVQLLGRTGKRLLVRASKTGFETMDKAGISREYSDKSLDLYKVPDKQNPDRLILRKRGGPDSLIRRDDIRVPLPPNGQTVGIDVVSQIGADPLSDRADLVFEVTPGRVREDVVDRFDWKVVIRAPSGDVRLGKKGAWEVPNDGFAKELVIEMRKDSSEWLDYLDRWIFFRSRDRQVQGLAHIYIAPSPRRAPVTVALEEYVVNPFGGRGLEYARETDVTGQFYRSPEQ